MGRSENSWKNKNKNGRRIRIKVTVKIIFDCTLYFLRCIPFVLISSHVRNPIPPTTINTTIVTLTSTLELYEVREENFPLTPIRSKPALQKADIEWNNEYHIPFHGPKSFTNTGERNIDPKASIINDENRINFVSLNTPPILWAERASCIVFLAKSPIFLPEIMARKPAMVTTPKPPIWIRTKMTTCPNKDQ